MKERRELDCLLLAPPEVGGAFPRGAAELATFLEGRGYRARVEPLGHYLGCEAPESDDGGDRLGSLLESLLEEYRPSVVGISNLFTVHFSSCARILALCKALDPHVVTVIGGPHVTFVDEEAARTPGIDAVARGEGEETLLALVECVLSGGDLGSVEGITFQDRDGFLFRTADRPPLDLSILPPIDFSLLPAAFMKNCHVYSVMTRGCAFKCSFCVEHRFWKRRRDHPLDRVIGELQRLEADFGNRGVGVEDAMVYLGAPLFQEFCQRVMSEEVPLHPEFFVLSRVDTVHPRGLELMNAAEIKHVRVGVESGSPAVRARMNKHITDEQIFNALGAFKATGLSTLVFWIIGHPGDSPDESVLSLAMLDSLFAQRLADFAVLSLFVPYPGTAFFETPQEHGIRILHRSWDLWHRWGYPPVCDLDTFSAAAISTAYDQAKETLVRHGQHLRQTPFEGEFSDYLARWAAGRVGGRMR